MDDADRRRDRVDDRNGRRALRWVLESGAAAGQPARERCIDEYVEIAIEVHVRLRLGIEKSV